MFIIDSGQTKNMSQHNHITNHQYQGKNQSELSAAKKANNFKSDSWLTFLQARESGLRIIKGSKGVRIFRGFRETEIKDKDGTSTTETRPMGHSIVFNLDQTEPKKKTGICNGCGNELEAIYENNGYSMPNGPERQEVVGYEPCEHRKESI